MTTGALGAAAAPDVPDYRAPLLLRGFHRMTLAAALGRVAGRRPPAEARVFRVDDCTAVLAACTWQEQRAVAPTLVLVHGLSGDANSPYMIGTARKAYAAGLNVVRMNLRGAGGSEALASTAYHGGLTDDLEAVVAELAEAGLGPVHLAGFSLGGNVVLRLAARWGAAGPDAVASVATVSPCVDLAASADRLDHDVGLTLYRRSFLSELKTLVRRKAQHVPGSYDPRGLADIRTLRAFDDRYVAPVHGFSDAADYYARASSLSVLDRVRLPSLLIHSRDDRLVPDAPLHGRAVRDNPALIVLLTDRGGHCGFIGRRRPPADADRFWAENRVVEWAVRHGARPDAGSPGVASLRAGLPGAASDAPPDR